MVAEVIKPVLTSDSAAMGNSGTGDNGVTAQEGSFAASHPELDFGDGSLKDNPNTGAYVSQYYYSVYGEYPTETQLEAMVQAITYYAHTLPENAFDGNYTALCRSVVESGVQPDGYADGVKDGAENQTGDGSQTEPAQMPYAAAQSSRPTGGNTGGGGSGNSGGGSGNELEEYAKYLTSNILKAFKDLGNITNVTGYGRLFGIPITEAVLRNMNTSDLEKLYQLFTSTGEEMLTIKIGGNTIKSIPVKTIKLTLLKQSEPNTFKLYPTKYKSLNNYISETKKELVKKIKEVADDTSLSDSDKAAQISNLYLRLNEIEEFEQSNKNGKVSQLKVQIKKLQNQQSNKEKELNNAKSAQRNNVKEIAKLENDIKKLQKRIPQTDAIKKEIENKQKQLKAANNKKKELKDNIKTLETDIDNLKKQLRDGPYKEYRQYNVVRDYIDEASKYGVDNRVMNACNGCSTTSAILGDPALRAKLVERLKLLAKNDPAKYGKFLTSEGELNIDAITKESRASAIEGQFDGSLFKTPQEWKKLNEITTVCRGLVDSSNDAASAKKSLVKNLSDEQKTYLAEKFGSNWADKIINNMIYGTALEDKAKNILTATRGEGGYCYLEELGLNMVNGDVPGEYRYDAGHLNVRVAGTSNLINEILGQQDAYKFTAPPVATGTSQGGLINTLNNISDFQNTVIYNNNHYIHPVAIINGQLYVQDSQPGTVRPFNVNGYYRVHQINSQPNNQ